MKRRFPASLWIMGPDNMPVLLSDAKKIPTQGFWCREGDKKWQPIATLKANLAKGGKEPDADR